MLRAILSFILALFFTTSSYAEIYEALSLDDVKQWLDKADETTLVTFDMDYTIIMPEHPAFHRPNSWKYRDWLFDLQSHLTPDERNQRSH